MTSLVLNNIGFIVAGPNRSVFVQLIYLSKDKIAVLHTLQSALRSLRFAG